MSKLQFETVSAAMPRKALTDICKQLRAAGYTVERDHNSGTTKASMTTQKGHTVEVLRSMRHSNRRVHLVRAAKGLITAG